VPTEETVEIRNGAKKTVTRTSQPGIRPRPHGPEPDDSWSAVRHTPSVTGFVGYGNTPVALDLEEVVKMLSPSVIAKAAAGAGRRADARRSRLPTSRSATPSWLVDGPFAGVHPRSWRSTRTREGHCDGRLHGRETPIELDFSKVQKSS